MTTTSERWYGRLTAPDVTARLSADTVLCLPIGSYEQHGPHLPLHTDTIIAEGFTRRLLARHGDTYNLVGLPPIPYGLMLEHSWAPGRLPLDHSARPSDEIAERLDLGDNTEVVMRENWYFADDEPVQIGVTFIPVAIADGAPLLATEVAVGPGSINGRAGRHFVGADPPGSDAYSVVKVSCSRRCGLSCGGRARIGCNSADPAPSAGQAAARSLPHTRPPPAPPA